MLSQSNLTDILLKKYSISSDQMTIKRLNIILNNLETILNLSIPGEVVEFGCYSGTTSLYLQRLILGISPNRKLYLYDSFNGLPNKSNEDQSPSGEQYKEGELTASKQQLIHNFKKNGLLIPKIYSRWFKDLLANEIPTKICFAFIDADFYNSTLEALDLVWPNLNPAGILIIDDANRLDLPGVDKAITKFKANHNCSVQITNNLAIIKKLARK